MALVLTIQQLLDMADGGVPEAFKATVKKVFAPRTGSGDDGPWTLQKIEVADSTGTIECMLSNRPEMSRSMEGKQIYVMAGRGQRGLIGLKRKTNNHNGRVTPQVWIYYSADVTAEGASSGATQEQQQPQREQQPRNQAPTRTSPPQNSRPQNDPPAAPQNGRSREDADAARTTEIKRFDRGVAKVKAAYERCFDAAFALTADLDARYKDLGGFKPDAATIEKIAACIMVQAAWDKKPAAIEDFPVRSFHTYANGTGQNGNGAPPNGHHQEQRQGAPFN